jgi:uncharacterized HhH-GPD family protein
MRLNMPVSDKANELLTKDPFALLVALVLDQQIPLERAFASPLDLKQRLGGKLTPKIIAATDPDELDKIFAQPPALHRFPAANAQRVQKLAHIILDEYKGRADSIWLQAPNGVELLKRVKALPGFGEQKAKIFVALLGKQFDVKPAGWRAACAPFGDKGTTMSIADITDEESLARVRAWKQAKKAAAKAAAQSGEVG